MRINTPLIARSDLLAAIVEKIETFYAEDISLLICYGSFVTGDYAATSDIDFFFVPRTKRGGELGHQFILDEIGYDLWPVSWERLTQISNLEDQPASILMDGEALFASSDEDLRNLDRLKGAFSQNLKDETLVRKLFARHIEKAKAICFDLQNHERGLAFIDGMKIVETLLLASATLNGTYIKKGAKRIENELAGLPLKPAGFLEDYRRLIETNDQADLQRIVREMIVETEKIGQAKSTRDGEDLDPSALTGFYEEFKSTYNKLLHACDEKNYEAAYYAGFMIDRETLAFLSGFTGPGAFPRMIDAVLQHDFDALRVTCRAHERRLLALLAEKGIAVQAYGDMDDFRRRFLDFERKA